MCEYFDKVFDLSAKLTDWSINSGIKLAPGRNVAGVTRYAAHEDPKNSKVENAEANRDQSFLICTGGGPGFMEAANMGSASVTDARSIGVRVIIIISMFIFHQLCTTYNIWCVSISICLTM